MNNLSCSLALLSALPFLGMGCNAAMNPPQIPGKTVAPTVALLWSESPKEDSGESGNLQTPQGFDLGLNKGIVATVDQKAITLKEFDSAFFRALRNKPRDLSEEDLYHQVLNDLVINKLLLLYGEGLEDLKVSDFELDLEMEKVLAQHPEGWQGYRQMLNMESLSLLDIREQIKESLLLRKVQGEIFRGMGSPSPKEIRAEYEHRKKEFETEDESDVSLIIIFNDTYKDNKEGLDALVARVKKLLDERPFEEVARQFSEGPKAEAGGRQGWITKRGLSPELSKIAFDLSKGEQSGPHVAKDFTFFVKCHDSRQAGSKEMDEVQTLLENTIQNRKRQALMDAKIKELYALHHVQTLSPNDYLKYRASLQP